MSKQGPSTEIVGQIHVEDLNPELLNELLRKYPALRPFCTASPSRTSVAEHQEKALIDLAIVMAPSILNMIGAVLNFLAARKARATKITLSQGNGEPKDEAKNV